MWPADHVATGTSKRDFTMDVDFDKFRQIMVRKNATEAIVSHSGMTLLNEKVNDLSVDVPKQKRPILNALLGKSNADLSASKQITVNLNNPDIDTKKMNLNQQVHIGPDNMEVNSEASDLVGNLTAYSTQLHAMKAGGGTQVELSIHQTIHVKVPKLFLSEADRRVQMSAENAIAEQEKAIRSFIALYEKDAIVLPELK